MKKVKVYWNSRAYKFSVQQDGRVIGHYESLMLNDVEFTVRESGRERVLAEKVKNVHAFVAGIITNTALQGMVAKGTILRDPDSGAISHIMDKETQQLFRLGTASYDPKENSTFVREDGSPIYRANWVKLFVVMDKPELIVLEEVDVPRF